VQLGVSVAFEFDKNTKAICVLFFACLYLLVVCLLVYFNLNGE